MQTLLELLERCAEANPFDTGDPENKTVLDQLFCAYQDSHETDPPEIKDGFKDLLYGILKLWTYRQEAALNQPTPWLAHQHGGGKYNVAQITDIHLILPPS